MTVKLACWEVLMQDKISRARKLELQALRGQKMLDAVCVFLWAACPAVLAGLTFTVYVALGNELKPAEVVPVFSYVCFVQHYLARFCELEKSPVFYTKKSLKFFEQPTDACRSRLLFVY